MVDTENTPLIDPNILNKPKETAPVVPGQPLKMPSKSATVPDKGGFIWGTGRRKTSVARVRIRQGKGEFKINDRNVDQYFTQPQDRNSVQAPLKALNVLSSFDVFVNVKGGGTTGQAGATMLGIARALLRYEPNWVAALRDGGYLTRDSRMVERKKPGKAGARRRFQFSKR
jgi:small subunit ribosomal protein S9